MIQFTNRDKPVTVQGVELVFKPMKLGDGEAVRTDPNKKDKKLQWYLVLCVFNADGTPGFKDANEVDALDDPTFYELWEHVKQVNCWTVADTTEKKTDSPNTAES